MMLVFGTFIAVTWVWRSKYYAQEALGWFEDHVGSLRPLVSETYVKQEDEMAQESLS